jgi:glycosyltransferase involved in cell wall biosynthesis
MTASGTDLRPHVVHVVGTLGAGGVQSLVLGIAGSSAGRAYRHSALCLFGAKGDLRDRFREEGIETASCPVPWPNSLDLGSYRASRWLRQRLACTFPFRLSRALARESADLVHTHVAHRIDLQAEGVLRRARLPMIWTIHGQYRPAGKELARWRRATRLAAEHPAAITAVSEELARDFRARGLDHPDGIAITRGGVDLSRFRSRVPADGAWRSRLGIPAEAVVFGAAGRLVPEKAYDVFVRAAARLVRRGAAVRFVIAGEGPLKESLRAEVARQGIEDRFHLVGFESDVPRFLGQLDVFVLSSRFEGFPVALIEALAAGLPAVATAVGGVPEMLGNRGGLIVRAESEEALAGAMHEMLDPRTRGTYAERGPAIADQFSIERCADGFARLYSRVLGNAARRPAGSSRDREGSEERVVAS